MFERLINNKISFATLEYQRRMRPEISHILKFIYPDLKDHSQVASYPNIKGVAENVFFLNHKF